MSDYSYIGSGRVYLKEVGGTAGLVEVGNASALAFNITEDTKSMNDYTQPGGGTYNEVKRISAVECAITFAEFSPANLARGIYGESTVVTTGAVTDEAHTVGSIGEFIPTTFLPSAIGTIKVGATTMVENTDYEVRPGGIKILGGAIAPADVVLMSYTKAGHDVVQAMVNSGKEFTMLFDGLNEARGGKRTRITAYRYKPGAARSLGFIGDDCGSMETTGKLLKDTTKVGAGISQYFKVEVEQ